MNQKHMITVIENEVQLTRSYIGKDKLDERVMDVMVRVPRDYFVPDDVKLMAFNNGPIPIGHGQTISQPYIVALMTDLLQLKPDDSVLEIGTGSGYQTAVLSLLCKKVYSVERIYQLNEIARQHFKDLIYNNIDTCVANGYEGWPEHAPYDAIIVTAAASNIPQPLIEQLKPGGNLVIPVGAAGKHQQLMRVKKDLQGEILIDSILGVAFVPLVNDSVSSLNESMN